MLTTVLKKIQNPALRLRQKNRDELCSSVINSLQAHVALHPTRKLTEPYMSAADAKYQIPAAAVAEEAVVVSPVAALSGKKLSLIGITRKFRASRVGVLVHQ